MSYAVLSETALAGVVRAGDSRRFSVNLKLHRHAIISAASSNALAASICLRTFNSTVLRGKRYVSYKHYEGVLLVRAVAKHIKKRLAIKMPDRNSAVKGIISSLTDSTPFHIVRCDISSFYESINVEKLKDMLLYDTSSSQIVRNYLREFFDVHCPTKFGLPRGAGISAVLSELALRPFDKELLRIPGVYRYYRYADDIIVFCTSNPSDVINAINKALPWGMRLNKNKSYIRSYDVAKTKKDREFSKPDVNFDFLGYNFSTSPISGGAGSRNIKVSISNKKISKIKTRIILSLKKYKIDLNHELLIDRLYFITSNYLVKRIGISHYKRYRHAYSGVYYNYSACGEYKIGSKGNLIRSAYDCIDLKSVDGFMKNLLFGKRSEFYRSIFYGMNVAQKRRLRKVSLFKGYSERMIVRFTPDHISYLKKAWRNE